MARNIKGLSEDSEKLVRKNKELQQQLREAKEYIDAIKTGSIDALVIADKNDLKVYTEKTADKTYRILIEKMHEGAVTLNEEGTILYCNSYFANMVNLPLQKVIGSKLKKFIDALSKERFEALLKQGRKNDIKEEIYLYTSGGKALPALMSVNALLLDNNIVLSIIFTDLTLRNKNLEDLKRRTKELELKNTELENANKDLTTLTFVSSHDLQEPLRKIKNFTICLLEEEQKNLSVTGKDYLQRMRKSVMRMQDLIEDLLTYSRVKNKDDKFEKTYPIKIAEEVIADFKEILQEKKAVIKAEGLCQISIIPFQFRQLIHNLISNSVKFSDPKKPLRISIKSKTSPGSKLKNDNLLPNIRYCHIIFTDNGIGFDPQYKDRIFEVFQRLHEYDKYKGTGIGLAICKRIVENHKGIITASGELNKGARFDIYIPAT